MIKSFLDWFLAWKKLRFPIVFKNRYDKDYDGLINLILSDNRTVLTVTKSSIIIKGCYPYGEIEILSNKRFYDYANGIFITGNGEINAGFRPSIKTMAKLYELEKEYFFGERGVKRFMVK